MHQWLFLCVHGFFCVCISALMRLTLILVDFRVNLENSNTQNSGKTGFLIVVAVFLAAIYKVKNERTPV